MEQDRELQRTEGIPSKPESIRLPDNIITVMRRAATENPRDEIGAGERSLRELEAVPKLAERAYYSIPYRDKEKKEKPVEGLSIWAAHSLKRHYRNCISGGHFVSEDNSHVVVEGIFLDIESNSLEVRPYKVSKFWTPSGSNRRIPMDGTMLRNAIHSAISKAERNAILRGLPEWYKEQYFEQAKQLVLKPKTKGGPVKSVQERIADGKNAIVRDFGIKQKELNEYMAEAFDGLDNDSVLSNLIGIYSALKSGEVSKDELLSGKREVQLQEAGPKKK